MWRNRDNLQEQLQIRKLGKQGKEEEWMWIFDYRGDNRTQDVWELNSAVRFYIQNTDPKKPFENYFEAYLLAGLIEGVKGIRYDEIKILSHGIYFQEIVESLQEIYESKQSA